MIILIVDDDAHMVQSIRNRIDWARLGIRQVLTASNIRQAQSALSVYPVDILLCDIEMPQGSGLDLLEWMREQGMDTPAIFLTSYANFDYARRALALESLEYYLKPVEYGQLEEGLARAVEKATARKQAKRYQQQSELWEHNRGNLQEHFWRQVIGGKMAGDALAVANQIENDMLPYTPESLFLPVLLHIIDRHGDIDSWGPDAFNYGMLNLMNEIFAEKAAKPQTIQQIAEGTWLVLLPVPSEKQFFDITTATDQLIETINKYFAMDVFCGIGYMNVIHQLHGNISDLQEMLTNNVHQVNQSLQLSHYEFRDAPYHPPDIGAWEALLDSRDNQRLTGQVLAYLDEMEARQAANAETLKRFRLDITQLIYSFLRRREIQVNELFYNEESERAYQNSVVTINDMKAYVRHLIDSATGYSRYLQQPDGVVEKLVRYLDENYQQEISREDMAKMVFLNPDYISRLFKKSTGKSISSYLTDKRVKKARELLRDTDMPVYAVSICVGYDNFAYFSKVFKKSTGMSPNEYRKGGKPQTGPE